MAKRIAKKKIKSDKKNLRYWQDLLSDFSLTSKCWLEDYDLPHHRTLSKEKITDYESILLNFNQDNKATLYAMLHAAWAILLHRYTGSDDIIYGITTHPLLPIRSIIREGESIQTFIKKLNNQTQNNKKNAPYFEDDKRLHTRVNEWVNYLFLYPHTKIKNKPLLFENTLERYPLICMIENEKPITIKIYYNNKKYSKKSIKNIASHYTLIIKKMMDAPQDELAHLSILTNNEKIKLNRFNKPNYPQLNIQMNIGCHELFMAEAKKNPNNLAVTDGIHHLTYKQLDDLSNQLADSLLKKI